MSLLEELAATEDRDAYDDLPEALRATFTRKEWSWMSDTQKANLSVDELEPENYDY